MEMLAGGVILLVAGTMVGEWSAFNLAAISQRSAIAFVYLVLVGAMVGFTAYLWLIKNVPPALATTYAFVNPVVAMYVGWLVAAEPITPQTVLAAAVIIAGVALITQARQRPAVGKPTKGPT
jgi:drug/metabolite transporter (DMT)-like permease